MRSTFPELEVQRARERWRYTNTPIRIAKVLSHDRYWTLPFLRFYADRIDELSFEDPQGAADLAKPLGELAARIRVREGEPKHYHSEAEKLSWQLYAWTVRAGANVCAERKEEAEYSFAMAEKFLTDGPKDVEALGEYYRRLGLYRALQQKPEAIEMFSTAIRMFEPSAQRLVENLALAYVGRAMAHEFTASDFGSAMADYSEALARITPSDRGQRTAFISLHNLGCLIATRARTSELMSTTDKVLARVEEAVKGPHSLKFRACRGKLRWSQAMLMARVYMYRHSCRLLGKAHKDFVHQELHHDAAVALIDQIHVYFLDSEAKKAKAAYDELCTFLEDHPDVAENLPRWQRMPTPDEAAAAVDQIRGAQCAPPGEIAL